MLDLFTLDMIQMERRPHDNLISERTWSIYGRWGLTIAIEALFMCSFLQCSSFGEVNGMLTGYAYETWRFIL